MTNYKFIATVILISSKLCFGQDGFRKELPFEEFKLDTPFTFNHFDDYQIIDYLKDSVKGELFYSCKVNEQGNELLCLSKNTGDTALNHRSMSFYEVDGKLHSVKSYYPHRNEYRVSLFTYDTKGHKIKNELFKYREHWDLKPGVLPDSVGYIVPDDTVNMKKLENDSNYNIYKSWNQSDLWTWEYDEKGRVIESSHVDDFNQKFKTKTSYDKKGRILQELGYRNFLDFENNKEKISDSLTVITDYKCFKNGFTRVSKNWSLYIYTDIDTLITNSRDQIVKKISWWEYTDNAKPKADEIPLTHIENIIIEYDNIGRKVKRTTETDKYKYSEVYRYRNDNVHDLKQEEF